VGKRGLIDCLEVYDSASCIPSHLLVHALRLRYAHLFFAKADNQELYQVCRTSDAGFQLSSVVSTIK
jgi:hypothetical protein